MGLHLLFRENIHADPGRVVESPPKVFHKPLGIQQIQSAEALVGQFLHTQQNHAALGIGEGGIGLPDTLRQAAQGLFRLDPVIFPVILQIVQVQHCTPPPFFILV